MATDLRKRKNEKVEEVIEEKVIDVDINQEMKTSFLSYAMSVIVARALPDVRDGLKPVHRRILFAMNDLGVYSDRPHKKSARIVGDVIGKYHPHGDSAVYEAMVRMAQDFSYRYPLVDGQGNFGSIDGDGAAAMRYTEARMSKLSAELLRDLDHNTVDFQDNYDGSESEPVVLPARFPHLLVNGATGIAVGMATNIPPHNLNEVINGTLALLEDPTLPIEKLIEFIPAPDYPTGGIIVGTQQIKKAYLTGSGTITVRAKVKVINSKKPEIIITEIPYQVNKTRLIERIAELAKEHIIEGITDIRDETSNKNGMRIVLELKRDANVKVLLNNLYRHTQMQTTYGVNMIALDQGQPKVMNLKMILEYYIAHQVEVITRRCQFDLDKALARLHIVKGLIIALANIDEVVALIKASKNNEEASSKLIANFLLTEIQAKAILEMRLMALTGLQVEKLQEEERKLEETVNYLQEVLADDHKKKAIIITEMTEIQKRFGDKRMSVIDEEVDVAVNQEDLIPVEDVIITITNKGYVKRMSVDTYKAQKRGGRGIKAAKVQNDDFIERVIYSSTHENLLFFTNFGKLYTLKAYQIPVFNRKSKGIPLVNLLNFDSEEKLASIINCQSLEQGGYLIFATKNGIIKKTELIQYKNIRSSGIRAILLGDQDELVGVCLTDGSKNILLGASNGKAIRFDEGLIRPTNRAASGVKGMKLASDERLIGMGIIESEEDEVVILTEKGYGKRTKIAAFSERGRNGKGIKFTNINAKTGVPIWIQIANGENDLIIITDKGIIIRLHLNQLSLFGRDSQGVKVINLNEDQTVVSSAIVPYSDTSSIDDDLDDTDESDDSEE